MIIFKDILTGDEMFTDIYPRKESKHGSLYIVEGKHVTRTNTFDDTLIGANASAEEQQCEVSDESSTSGVDIVLNNKLQETCFTKKDFLAYLRVYVKVIIEKLRETNPDRVDSFKCAIQKDLTDVILPVFPDLQFFTGESMNPDGMVGLLNYDENAPYMMFFKDGLEEEKC